ncbi:hypothetical protein TI04_05330 [Achromatium sp. WMS2]|nr:hypothetical protein TI04_05330 [Achromatium sp. WMS2]
MIFKDLFSKLGFGNTKRPRKQKNTKEKESITVDLNILDDASHPIWRRLAEHQIEITTNDFALQMLLSWAWKEHSQTGADGAMLENKVRLLYTIFNKNQRALQNEINQLLKQGQYV